MGEGNHYPTSPHPPTPSPTAQSLGRGGASGVPVAYTTNHSLIPSSQLPSPRKWERGRGEGKLQASGEGSYSTDFPSPPGLLSHGASLGRGGASGVPVAHTTDHSLIPSSQLPSPRKWERGRGEGNPQARSGGVVSTSLACAPMLPAVPLLAPGRQPWVGIKCVGGDR